jgi:hypothetical protein
MKTRAGEEHLAGGGQALIMAYGQNLCRLRGRLDPGLLGSAEYFCVLEQGSNMNEGDNLEGGFS